MVIIIIIIIIMSQLIKNRVLKKVKGEAAMLMKYIKTIIMGIL